MANPTLRRQRERIVATKTYATLNEKWDIYVPFMELGLGLLAPGGVMTMIVPHPLTNQKYAKKLRRLIAENTQIVQIADLDGTKIFENAAVNNCIPIVKKAVPAESLGIVHVDDEKLFRMAFRKPTAELTQDEETQVWNLTQKRRRAGRHLDMNVLGDYCYISVGMVLNADEKTAKGEFSKENLISLEQDDLHPRAYVEAKDIDRYEVKRVRFLEWDTDRCPGRLRRPTFRELYEVPKLMINSLGGFKATFDNDNNFLHNHSLCCAVLWKDLRNVENKSISGSVRRYSRKSRQEMERLSEGVRLPYLLAILNSETATSLLADIRGNGLSIYPEHVRNLPIAPATAAEQEAICSLAREVMERKAQGKATAELEEEIDRLVAGLYAGV